MLHVGGLRGRIVRIVCAATGHIAGGMATRAHAGRAFSKWAEARECAVVGAELGYWARGRIGRVEVVNAEGRAEERFGGKAQRWVVAFELKGAVAGELRGDEETVM